MLNNMKKTENDNEYNKILEMLKKKLMTNKKPTENIVFINTINVDQFKIKLKNQNQYQKNTMLKLKLKNQFSMIIYQT